MAKKSESLNDYSNKDFNLAWSSYGDKNNDVCFPDKIDKNNPIIIRYPEGPTVYLQPIQIQDVETGLQVYIVTDQKNMLDNQSANFVIRGSDGFVKNNSGNPDWFKNDIPFGLSHGKYQIPQANSAKNALLKQIEDNPNINSWNLQGHSLGTMVSIQALSLLSPNEIDKIGAVTLFNGPNVNYESMSKEQKAAIDKLEVAGKITYYINPFDPVSVLNRDSGHQIGKIKIINPRQQGLFFFQHSMTESQIIDQQVDIVEEGDKFFEQYNEYIAILANFERRLIDDFGSQLKDSQLAKIIELFQSGRFDIDSIVDIISGFGISFGRVGSLAGKVSKYVFEYNNLADMYFAGINQLNEKINGSSGTEKIQYQTELINAVSKEAKSAVKVYSNQLKQHHNQYEQIIIEKGNIIKNFVFETGANLDDQEMNQLIHDFTKETIWNTDQINYNQKENKKYKNQLNKFSKNLNNIATNAKRRDYQDSTFFSETKF